MFIHRGLVIINCNGPIVFKKADLKHLLYHTHNPNKSNLMSHLRLSKVHPLILSTNIIIV